LPVDKAGIVDLEKLEKRLFCEGASMVSIMWANNEIGTVEPMQTICQLVQDVSSRQGREIFHHSDSVQVIGKLKVDMKELPLSAISFSGHKFGAPKGIGALFLRRLVNVMPIIFGGGQEMGLMPGTEPLANIVALGEAARLARLEQAEAEERLRRYQERLLAAVKDYRRC
jgi:cysteine desulfurase